MGREINQSAINEFQHFHLQILIKSHNLLDFPKGRGCVMLNWFSNYCLWNLGVEVWGCSLGPKSYFLYITLRSIGVLQADNAKRIYENTMHGFQNSCALK